MKRLGRTLSLFACLFLLVAAPASAAKKAPVIKSFSPKTAAVGEKMVLRGKYFLPGKKSRVYFLGSGGKFGFAQADAGTKTRLVVTVPDLTEHLRRSGNGFLPTRFKLRVLGKKLGKATSPRKSPLIVAAADAGGGGGGTPGPTNAPDGDCDGDGQLNSVESDDDDDLLLDGTEETVTKTDPCKIDTDGDSIEDGYEFNSALDLNNNPSYVLPYPGKRPYPNPLDSSDAPRDYDGDGLDLRDEFRLFITFGGHALPLNYSDGTQTTQPETMAAYEARNPAGINATLLNFYLDIDSDGSLSDDEKDADGDGLGNWDESHGRMTQEWWDKFYTGKTACTPKETRYVLDYAPVDLTDPDSDGDTAKDGVDDQDHDGLSNAYEVNRLDMFSFPCTWANDYISRVHPGGTEPWARVQPYNPCKPFTSDTCHRYVPFGYYGDTEDVIADPPAPGTPVPTTPNG